MCAFSISCLAIWRVFCIISAIFLTQYFARLEFQERKKDHSSFILFIVLFKCLGHHQFILSCCDFVFVYSRIICQQQHTWTHRTKGTNWFFLDHLKTQVKQNKANGFIIDRFFLFRVFNQSYSKLKSFAKVAHLVQLFKLMFLFVCEKPIIQFLAIRILTAQETLWTSSQPVSVQIVAITT